MLHKLINVFSLIFSTNYGTLLKHSEKLVCFMIKIICLSMFFASQIIFEANNVIIFQGVIPVYQKNLPVLSDLFSRQMHFLQKKKHHKSSLSGQTLLGET